MPYKDPQARIDHSVRRRQRLNAQGLCACGRKLSTQTLCRDCAGWLRGYCRERNTGCSVEVYERLLIKQNGKCAICKRGPGKRALAADHCHLTQRIRGLLCGKCNVGLGMFGDDPKVLRRALKYLD